MSCYVEQKNVQLRNAEKQHRVCDCVYVSRISGLSLSEYVAARAAHCSTNHARPCCSGCDGLLMVGKTVLEQGYCSLSEAFKLASQGVKYTAEHARRKFLQMPLVSIRIGDPSRGQSFSILMEMFPGMDYSKVGVILNGLSLGQSATRNVTLEKSIVKMLLNIAQSDRERMCLRYAISKASGMTPTAVRRVYGFEHISAHVEEVEKTLSKVQQIHEAISDLASIEDKALIQSFGLEEEANSCSSESEEEIGTDDAEEGSRVSEPVLNITENLKTLLHRCDWNWFEFIECLQSQKQKDVSSMSAELFESVSKYDLDEKEMSLLNHSYLAFCAAEVEAYDQNRIARAVNGEVVSESESDSPEAYVGVSDPLSTGGRQLIAKKRKMIKRRARRRRQKAIADQRFLARCRKEQIDSCRCSQTLERR